MPNCSVSPLQWLQSAEVFRGDSPSPVPRWRSVEELAGTERASLDVRMCRSRRIATTKRIQKMMGIFDVIVTRCTELFLVVSERRRGLRAGWC